jgi:peptidyl-dipeptidase A
VPDVATELEERLRPLARTRNLAGWEVSIEATDENERRRAEADLAFSDALADSEAFAGVQAARGDDGDPLLHRRLDLLHDLMLPRQVSAALRGRIVKLEASVAARYSRHRGVVGGEEVDDVAIKKILRESDDAGERREAWEASKTVGAEVADDVRELARMRNEAARGLGYRDWFALAIATSEMTEERLLETLAAADRVTAEPFARWKATLDGRLAERFGCATADLRPWHYADPFFQETPPDGAVDLDPYFRERDVVELATRTFDGLEVDVGPVLGRSDLFPRARKNQHAFCLDVDREGDVRILANLTDNHDSMDTLLHELGHAVYDLGYDRGLDWLLRDTHLVPTEASALLFGSLAGDRDWLERVLGLSGDEAAHLEQQLREARAAQMLVFTRWVLVMTGFERELYGDPEADLDSIWWELVRRHQLVTPPEDRRAPDWAAKLHIALAPVYYHTYLYGAMVAAQIREFLGAEAGGIVDRPGAGKLLTERLYAPGLSIRWDQLVERATGSPLSVEALATEVAPLSA